jgi:ClpP class serine protease
MWLIQESVLHELEGIAKSGIVLTEAQAQHFSASASEAPEAAASRISKRAGATAEIRVDGVLTERPSLLAMLLGLGGTSYQAIRSALAQADGDPEVSDAALVVSSPGGHIDGLFDTIAAIQAFSKPIVVRASNAQSAAYALAAAAGPIEATTPAATFGSIGVVAGFQIDDKRVEITNSASPNKRPDISTPEGKAAVREHLDDLHGLFVGAIVEGRALHARDTKITPSLVNETFGRGATVLAAKARELKMIDRAPKALKRRPPMASAEEVSAPELAPEPVPQPAPVGAQTKAKNKMNKKELQEQHPEVYASVLAEGRVEGVADGETKERKRVSALLKLGKSSGDMGIAEKAIAAGSSPQDDEVFAEFQAAAMNRRDVSARQSESDAAGEATRTAATPAGGVAKDLGDRICDAMGLPAAADKP